MKSKRRRRDGIASWWRRQSTSIKVAFIAGAFGLLSALCGLFGSGISPILAYVSARTSPTVSVDIIFDDFNWASGIYALDPPNPGHAFAIVTNTCLEGYSEYGVLIRTDDHIPEGSSTQYLEGVFGIVIITDKPIVIKQVNLRVLEFAPVDMGVPHPVFWDIGGGGPGWVNEIVVDAVEVLPRPRDYAILGARNYQLPGNDAVTFMVPVRFSEPGSYVLQFAVSTVSYLRRVSLVETEPFAIKWLHLSDIDPVEVEPPPGYSGSYGDVQFRLCP